MIHGASPEPSRGANRNGDTQRKSQWGHEGGVPVLGMANPGGPQSPKIPANETGELKTGLPVAMSYVHPESGGFSYTGLLSLPTAEFPVLVSDEPT
jgi:hypothetical protein